MPIVFCQELEDLVSTIFLSSGASVENSRIVANHLVESNLAGHDSHGVLRVPQYVDAIRNREIVPDAKPQLIHETPGSAVLDGQSSFGQVAVRDAMKLAIDKARVVGIGAVTTRNCYHSGCIAEHSKLAAYQEMVGIVMVNAGGGGQSVAPYGGIQRRLATNPISIAAPPTDPFPVILDIASSVAPEGKIRDFLQRSEGVPEGWILDSQGNSSTNPQDFYGPPQGALLPFGGQVGYKGFGLGVMIDILAGALSGAGCCSEEFVPAREGVLCLALDVSKFTSLTAFHQHVLRLIEHVKSCPPRPGFEEVFMPGEREHRMRKKLLKDGLSIPEDLWNQLLENSRNLKKKFSSTPLDGIPTTMSERRVRNPA